MRWRHALNSEQREVFARRPPGCIKSPVRSRFCHLWAGSESSRDSISRLSRDMAVATQHVVVDPITLVPCAAIMDSCAKATKDS